jgi:hypothetical protein
VERYIATCVGRYAASPALGQWILWNEPAGGGDRTPETLGRWREFLRGHYAGDIVGLNRRWLTAYAGFEEVPFAEAVPHPLHRGSHWAPYRAMLDDAAFRAEWLNHQLGWIAGRVRALDAKTELCINPTQVIANQAAGGTDLAGMGRICEVIGASYHPAWQFAPFAQRADYPGLMSAGVRHCASHPEVRRVEVTEVQMGNTFQSSHRPNTVHPGELLRFFLAGLAAGAETITGWCFNIRTHDNEAGDWALLDDNDEPGPRCAGFATCGARRRRSAGGGRPRRPMCGCRSTPGRRRLRWSRLRRIRRCRVGVCRIVLMEWRCSRSDAAKWGWRPRRCGRAIYRRCRWVRARWRWFRISSRGRSPRRRDCWRGRRRAARW